jgi:hypothetical protein
MSGGKSTTFANQFLALFLNGTTATLGAITFTRSASQTLYWALHTADPGAAGYQNTSEAAYTSYARLAIVATSANFTVSGNTATVIANQDFVTATGGSETETFFSIGTASSGAGQILWRGPLTPSITVSSGVQPQINSGTVITET